MVWRGRLRARDLRPTAAQKLPKRDLSQTSMAYQPDKFAVAYSPSESRRRRTAGGNRVFPSMLPPFFLLYPPAMPQRKRGGRGLGRDLTFSFGPFIHSVCGSYRVSLVRWGAPVPQVVTYPVT